MTHRSSRRVRFLMAVVCALGLVLAGAGAAAAWGGQRQPHSLWALYYAQLRQAKYVDLHAHDHAVDPSVGRVSGPRCSRRRRTRRPGCPTHTPPTASRRRRTSCRQTSSELQLDPPAHWAPEYAAIDELPPTFAVRPLVVISIVPQVQRDFNYHLQVSDILRWEHQGYGRIPEGSVVMVRSDWSKRWPDPNLALLTRFPGVSLAALQFLHLQRHILFHGHEPLDTDSTPTLEGESWLMHHGFAQAEGVANLDQVPPTGCLIEMGFPKFGGGLGGYARFIAICPKGWRYGVSVGELPEAPLSALRQQPCTGIRC